MRDIFFTSIRNDYTRAISLCVSSPAESENNYGVMTHGRGRLPAAMIDPGSSNQAAPGVIVPFYVSPADIYNNADYNALLAAIKAYPKVPVTVVLNPSNGAGSSTDANYAAAVKRLQGAGARVLGYIATTLTTTTLANAKIAVEAWRSYYPGIDGIFVDQMTTDSNGTHVNYYRDLYTYCYARGLTWVVANAGAATPGDYFDTKVADVIITHEGTSFPSEATLRGNSAGGNSDYSPGRRAALIYNQGSLDHAALATLLKYNRTVYISEVASNPWNSPSSLLTQLLQSITAGSASDVLFGTFAAALLPPDLGTGHTINGVTLASGGSSTLFLAQDGVYRTAGSSGALLAANNLSDLTDAAAARTNLGLSTVATWTLGQFDTQVRTSRLDQLATPAANIALGGYLITGAGTPTASDHLVNKGYADNLITNLFKGMGGIDCSANPNYPAATSGYQTWIVTVAGKIGGASGLNVDIGDQIVASAANAGGTQAAVGTSWFILEHNLVGALLASNNLSDVADAPTARTNLGLGSLATQNGTFSGSSSGANTGDQTITLTGDVTGSGGGTFAATLANTAVTPGTYTFGSFTVDSKGRITAASSGVEGELTVTQTAHSFSVGQVIRSSGDDTYALADATNATNAEWAGVVSAVVDANTFKYKTPGNFLTTSGLTASSTYYLGDTPGSIVPTPGTINVALGFASNTTTLQLRWSRPQAAAVGDGTGTVAGLFSVDNFNKLAATKRITVDMIMSTAPSFTGLGATDGYTPVAGDLIFVAVQGAGSVNNGFWLASAGAWTRPTWANSSAALLGMRAVAKANGNANTNGAEVAITNTSAITIGTTPITVSQHFNSGVAVDGQLSINKWGSSSVGQSLAFYSNGGNSATFSLTRAAGANGNTSMTATGTGTFTISNNNVIFTTVASSSSAVFGVAAAGATTQLGSSTQTTGAITVGPALTSGAITLGNASGTATHVVQSGVTGAAPILRSRGAIAGGITGLDSANTSSGTVANKFAQITFSGDSTPFKGAHIRANNTEALAWNNAGQFIELEFDVNVGTSTVQAMKIAKRGVLKLNRGLATNYTRVTANAQTVTVNAHENHVFFDGASLLATATVNLPASTTLVDGQELTISTGAFGVTTLTLNAGAGTAILVPPGLNFKDSKAVFKWKYIATGPVTPTWVFMGGSVSRGVMTHTDITATGNQNLFEGRNSVDTTLQASATYTLPSSPEDKVEVSVTFGGTVALGNPVITACTITAAQTVFGDFASFTAYSGDTYVFRYNSAKTRWEVI